MIRDREYYINNLNVLYEDNHILVIEKPENVLSQKDKTNDFDINEIVKEYLKRKYNKPGNVYLGLVHRLDRRVGGVMVLAKTSKAASRISVDIQKHNFDKYYIAKCQGRLDNKGSINIKIKKVDNLAVVSNDGQNAMLDYKTLYSNGEYSYALVDLLTGRYNQIRLSFSYIDHPLVGDYKYGGIKKDRIGLWCYKIRLVHPVTKELMEFVSLPKGEFWKDIEKFVKY